MKKSFIHIFTFSLVAALLVNTSCENYVDGVSEFDPTLPRDASVGQVINSAEVSLISFAEGDLARLAGMWTGQFTGSDRQYASLNNYISTAGDYDSQWGNIYANALKSLRIAQNKAKTANNKRALGLAQILEAYTIGTTAALFGDIPYTQAVNNVEFPNPSYDLQEDVYAKIITLLDAAIANINTAAEGTEFDGDIFGGGDAEWIQRANTLKAKFYLHLGQYANALAAAELGISHPNNDVIAEHGTSYLIDMNSYSSFLDWDRVGYMSAEEAYAPRLLDPTIDADDAVSYNRNNAKTNEGARFNFIYLDSLGVYNAGYELNFFSIAYYKPRPDGFFGADAPWAMITHRENQLILAECELRVNGMTAGLDELNKYRAHLDSGGYINPAFKARGLNYEAYDAADFNAGGMENADGLPAADALYREIIEEKYVSLLGTLEVFNDMRRRGFGSFSGNQNWEVLGIEPTTGTTIPQRFLIPQTERNSNTSAPPNPPGLFDKTAVFE